MNPLLLIALALVFPLVWGYLAEQILRRIWPRRESGSTTNGERLIAKPGPPTLPDYQI